MDKRIAVSEDALREVSKHIHFLLEETYYNLNNISKSIESAEMDGWNDNKFIEFKDDFLSADRVIKDGLRLMEDTLLPSIKKIEAIIEQY